MRKGGKIRVLIVDDSRLVRELIGAILAEDQDIEVVGEAVDGCQGVEKALLLKPDLITMDIEMPVMGGLEAIERIITARPTPILVVTAQTGVRVAFNAIAKGALEVIEKPDISLDNAARLLQRIRLLARVDVITHLRVMSGQPRRAAEAVARESPPEARGNGAGIIAIAASTGGPQAINTILGALPAHFPLPIVVAQHIADGFTRGMVDWLGAGTRLKVLLARSGDVLAPGVVHVNPGENSMYLVKGGRIILGDKDPIRRFSPSCDTLLGAVAELYRDRAVGVILSGMGSDGVMGIRAIKGMGGRTIAQDEASSVVYGMNQEAVKSGSVDRILPLAEIPRALMKLAGCR